MLQVRRETDYAVRCVYYLAQKPEALTLQREIAAEMNVPPVFLAKIVQKLVKAKIIKSFQGVKGGFRLARAPEKISLFDVVVAVEGPLALNVCTAHRRACRSRQHCKVHPFWVKARTQLEQTLQQVDFRTILASTAGS